MKLEFNSTKGTYEMEYRVYIDPDNPSQGTKQVRTTIGEITQFFRTKKHPTGVYITEHSTSEFLPPPPSPNPPPPSPNPIPQPEYFKISTKSFRFNLGGAKEPEGKMIDYNYLGGLEKPFFTIGSDDGRMDRNSAHTRDHWYISPSINGGDGHAYIGINVANKHIYVEYYGYKEV